MPQESMMLEGTAMAQEDKETKGDTVLNNGSFDQGQGVSAKSRWSNVVRIVKRHGAFVGPGMVAVTAYSDPGNLATDLQAGSKFGYSHLFVVLLSTLIALLYQILSARLGIVTGVDLASHCRASLHDRANHKMLYRWGVLYPLYVLSEIGIIFTDMSELLGSAVAIHLLIPQIPLPVCVCLTSLDIILILFLFNDYPARMVTRSMRIFEALIGFLVLAVLGSFVALLVKVNPDWGSAFYGFIPSSGVVDNGAVYIAVGILGATVQPQAFYIGSKLAAVQRIPVEQYESIELLRTTSYGSSRTYVSSRPRPPARLEHVATSSISAPISRLRNSRSLSALNSSVDVLSTTPPLDTGTTSTLIGPLNSDSSPQLDVLHPPSLACVRAHLGHAQFDIVGSLLGFAVVINSAILIVSAAAFYYRDGSDISTSGVTDLFAAHDLITTYVGPAFGYMFAIGLLASGQAASIIVTLSGQVLSEGFLKWNTKPWKRRAVTRAIGIVPSLAVSLAVGKQGIDVLLIGSQVALSFILPFVVAPLIVFTSSQSIMSVPINPSFAASASDPATFSAVHLPPLPSTASRSTSSARKSPRLASSLRAINPLQRRPNPVGHISFANSLLITWVCWTMCVFISMANIMALYQISQGSS